MQKYFTIFLTVLVLGLSVGFWWQNKKHLEELNKLNNELAKTKQLVKETETAYSSAALELENLKTENTKLQDLIKKRKEEIFALAEVAIQWQNKYFDIKNAKETVVDIAGSQPASISTECSECLANLRLKVDFEQTQDELKVSGFTLSNPAYAKIDVEWVKPLKLQLILTKTKEGNYKVYLDLKDKNNKVPTELTLKVDPSVLSYKWYEKIAVGADLGASQMGVNGSIRVMYGIKNNLYLGPSVTLSGLFNGTIAPFYGVSVLWLPFMREK
jgi:hypothetical protein